MPSEFSGRGAPDRSLALLWRRASGRRQKGPKPALTVDAIVAAAIRVADAEGLAAVSMRRVAEELGAGTMSLYRHVPGKGELVDLMLDQVIGELPTPGDDVVGWRARLELHARSGIEHYRRHPWVLDVGMSRPPLGPNLMANFESLLAAAAETGLPVGVWTAIAQSVGSYIDGAASWLVRAAQAEAATGVTDEQWWEARQEFWEDYYVPEDHPTITQVYEAGAFDGTPDPFEYGLQRLLDGIEARIAAARAGER